MSQPRGAVRDLLHMLWRQPLWAVPFAVFFALIYAPSWGGLITSYKLSLVFAFAIRCGLLAVKWWLLPPVLERLEARGNDLPTRSWTIGLYYAAGAMLGTAAAALLNHAFVLPGSFLGSGRAIALTFSYSLVFTALFLGINFAIVFYRQAVERARAVEQVRAELAQAELRALRAQIQPHFLFNTLNTIAALIAENPKVAEDTVTRLAEVFRHVLARSGQEHAPLGEELAFARDLLVIERLRLGERLRTEEAVESGLEAVPVPTLLLQPLVENAVRYGPETRPAGGTIRIAARRDGPHLVLEVEDDGPGFDPDAAPSGTGFGLHSVRERLRALGPPHAIEIRSAPGRGTRIRLTLPLDQARDAGPKGASS
jgi:two-component system sensor histidine kinase AlgZ